MKFLYLFFSFLFISLFLLKIDSYISTRNIQPDLNGHFFNDIHGKSQGKIFYQEVGEGPINLIFLHGIAASLDIWQETIKYFSPKQYHIVSMDLPGFGRSSYSSQSSFDVHSQAHRLLRLLQSLNIQKYSLIASSMGANIAAEMENLSPKSVQSLIFLDAASDPNLVPFPVYKYPHFFGWLAYALDNRFIIYLNHLNILYNRKLITHQRILYSTSRGNSIGNQIIFIKATQAIGAPEIPQIYKNIKTPTLIMWGEKDPIISKEIYEDLYHEIPNSQTATHPKASHHIMEDQPQWTSQHIQNFVQKVLVNPHN